MQIILTQEEYEALKAGASPALTAYKHKVEAAFSQLNHDIIARFESCHAFYPPHSDKVITYKPLVEALRKFYDAIKSVEAASGQRGETSGLHSQPKNRQGS